MKSLKVAITAMALLAAITCAAQQSYAWNGKNLDHNTDGSQLEGGGRGGTK